MRGRLLILAASLIVIVGYAPAAPTPAFAEGSAWWRLNATSAPSLLPREGEGHSGEAQLIVTATNVGDANVDAEGAPVTLTDVLPEGVTPVAVSGAVGEEPAKAAMVCPAPAGQTVECTFAGAVAPYAALKMRITVHMHISGPGARSLNGTVTVKGGNTPAPQPLEQTLRLAQAQGETTPFGVETYEMTPESEGGSFDVQAGSHPFQLTTTLDLNQVLDFYQLDGGEGSGYFPSAPAPAQGLRFKLPAGLVADTKAMPRCSGIQFATLLAPKWDNACPAETAVGVASVVANLPEPTLLGGVHYFEVPVFNLVPVPGEPARFGFELDEVPVILDTALVAGGEYAAEVSVTNTSETAQLLSSQVTIWGVPGDPRHDASRGWGCLLPKVLELSCVPEHETEPTPFLTLPTSCGKPLTTTVSGHSWPTGEPGNTGSPLAGENTEYTLPARLTGCNRLAVDPTFALEPERSSASTPTGLNATVGMAQEGLTSASGLAEAALRETTVTLPQGLALNPSAANGLQVCSASAEAFDFLDVFGLPFGSEGVPEEQQTGNLTSPSGPAHCPNAAKVGTVSIATPLLSGEITGSLYLAKQNTNPFKSPLAMYLVAENPESGVLVKLAGEVKVDSETGQLRTTFRNTPQLPFSSLELHLFGGGRASLATPPRCGRYSTRGEFTPWTEGSVATRTPEFSITSGANGEACPPSQLPFSPALTAGVEDTQAGAYTPFTVTVGQADGSQPLERIDMQLPSGIAALFSQVTPCPEAQALADKCESESPESLIGHTTAVAGLGDEPVVLKGQLYLTGELHATAGHPRAPFGVLAVTHAEAGPFDLGNVPVLSTLEVNPVTAAGSVLSEPIPKSVDGVPVDLKLLQVTLERPGDAPFMFNPTSCEPFSVTGDLTGYEGGNLPFSYPFQVTNCATLPFHPTLEAFTQGQASKAGGASLTVKVTSQGVGVANIHKVDLQLPGQLPSRLTTIQKACVAGVFESTATPGSACDEESVIGSATIHTPVFKNPLSGPAYLVSHGSAEFPDVEFVLQGEGVTVVLDGQTDIKHGITYSKFESAPDAPFTTFETTLPAGPHSALAANVAEAKDYNLCGETLEMPTTIVAQNGAVIEQSTKIAIEGCAGVKSVKVEKLTPAQELNKALAQCRKQYAHSKAKRVKCERAARARYAKATLAACRRQHKRAKDKRSSCEASKPADASSRARRR